MNDKPKQILIILVVVVVFVFLLVSLGILASMLPSLEVQVIAGGLGVAFSALLSYIESSRKKRNTSKQEKAAEQAYPDLFKEFREALEEEEKSLTNV